MRRIPVAANERTGDIYEQIADYPKPPLVPLPEPGDLDSLEKLGLASGRASRWILKAALCATGFRAFYEDLPYTIEDLLRRYNLRGPVLFAPVISATLALEDDPRNVSPIERAATLLLAAYGLYQDVFSGNLAPDQDRGQVLEMGQYPNLFSTSLILDGNRARIFKSTNVSQVTVAVARRFYSLQVKNLGAETAIEQLEEALVELVHAAQRNRLKADEPSPGILTCATDTTQRKAFHKLHKSGVNVESLSMLRHSFLTLCLDLDSNPSSYAEAAFVAHSGNCGNRWYHSSLQLVVFGNAKTCMICNFNAYVDGNVMIRAASEIHKRAMKCPTGNRTKRCFASLPPTTELRWEIDKRPFERALEDLRQVLDNQQATFEIHGLGTRFLASHNVQPVPAFTLALQMTANQLTGKVVRITQFLSMSKYRCMDLATAMVTTPEVMRFVDYVDSGDVRRDQATIVLQEAIDSQVRACRQARRHLSLEIILTLFVLSRKGIRQSYVSFIITSAIVFLRMVGLFKPRQREVVVSHPEICPDVPVVGRPGIRLPYVTYFGLHYQMLEDRIVVTIMPAVSWTIPNTELIAVLRENLKRIEWVIRGEQ